MLVKRSPDATLDLAGTTGAGIVCLVSTCAKLITYRTGKMPVLRRQIFLQIFLHTYLNI